MKLLKLLLISLIFHANTVLSTQSCNNDISNSTPNEHFKSNGDGTVIDNKTGLMWMVCSLGQTWTGEGCSGTAATLNWQDALAQANDATYSGFDDWYLPNIKELSSIVEDSCYDPSVNVELFAGIESYGYWSSTPNVKSKSNAFYIEFKDGYLFPQSKDFPFHVRLVRVAN
ncbi:MAG: DUF1566 domain-containing protein [Gammaproteobacteria bacterium]|nr:DUF1566 domain-containing protein [Gammaproteobacteria bacterium]